MRNHDEKLNLKKIRLLSFIFFIAGLAEALFLYVTSSYFKESFGTENVGIFFFLAYVVIFFAFLNLHKIVKKIGKSDVFYLVFFLKIAVLAPLLFIGGVWGGALVILYIIFDNLGWVILDIILESYSSDAVSGRIRGKILTLINAGFLLGPFVSVSMLEKYGYYGIFLAVLVANVIIFLIAAGKLGKVNHRFEKRLTVGAVLKKILRRKDIRRIFHISFVLEFFYAMMVVYATLYLLDIGISLSEIGIIFTAMLLPFVLIQYPAGVLADKKTGEKELLIAGVFLMGFSTLAIFFITSQNIWVWAAVLFLTRIGAALVEVLRDSYFCKRIDGHDVDIMNIFRTSRPLSYIIAAILSAVLLSFFPLKSVFILIALVVLSALYPAFRLADNRSERGN